MASSFGPAPPRVVVPALLVGIAGHALWNGSTVVLDAWLVDASVVTQFIVFVGWISSSLPWCCRLDVVSSRRP